MNLKIRLVLIFFVIALNASSQKGTKVAGAANHQPDMAWWHEARFGMFIHWGVSSIPGRGEWLMYQEHIPFSE